MNDSLPSFRRRSLVLPRCREAHDNASRFPLTHKKVNIKMPKLPTVANIHIHFLPECTNRPASPALKRKNATKWTADTLKHVNNRKAPLNLINWNKFLFPKLVCIVFLRENDSLRVWLGRRAAAAFDGFSPMLLSCNSCFTTGESMGKGLNFQVCVEHQPWARSKNMSSKLSAEGVLLVSFSLHWLECTSSSRTKWFHKKINGLLNISLLDSNWTTVLLLCCSLLLPSSAEASLIVLNAVIMLLCN